MRIVCAAVIVLSVPAMGSAQICAGRPSFDARPMQFRGAGAFAASQREAAVTVAHGVDRLFAQADANYDARSRLSRYGLSAAVATDQPLTLDNRVHLCPVVGLQYGWTPTRNRNAARLDLSVEIRLGLLAANTRAAAVIPTVAVGYRRRYAFGSDPIGNDGTALTSFAAVGIVLRNGVAFRPGVSVPLSGMPKEWGVTIELSVNLPRR